jgi:molybdopterin molybdotransferase
MTDEKRPRISVEEALDRILATVRVLEAERVPLLEAADRVLAEGVAADRDVPPLTNSAMDGYAVQAADLKALPARLRVIGEAPAGRVCLVTVEPGSAVRIMTGAPLPAGADTVVRFEDTRPDGQHVVVQRAPRPGANVRQAGEDVRAGQVVLQPGKALRPQEIGMLAAVGRTTILVHRRPRVAILATGDEIVPPDQLPGPGQIRDANSYTVAAQVRRYGGEPLLLGIARDEEALIRQGMHRALSGGADFIITSGGVSVGDFDLVKQVLTAEGEMHLWSLNMKPGRPMAFGVVGGVPLLGLPGNPVAAMVNTALFVRPALLKMEGFSSWALPTVQARLKGYRGRQDVRRHYIRVRLHETAAGYEATPTGDQGAGILNSLVQADGLAVLPEGWDPQTQGDVVAVIRLE